MKKNVENISKIEIGNKKILIILLLFLIFVGVYIYNASYYVVVRFNELGPLTKNMYAYYNGFKIGKIVRIGPDKDFKHILVKVNLNQNNIQLPQNTVVFVERFPNGELYLQFLYPNSPSLNSIKRGDMLEGIAQYNLEQFMMGQSVSGMSDVVSLHIIKALNSADAANQQMTEFFKVTSRLIKGNGKGITASVNNTEAMTKNLAEMAENLKQASQNLNLTSKKLNGTFEESILKDSALNVKDSTSNIKGATSNIKDTTENIAKATKDIDKTMQKVDDTISQLNSTARNLNSITGGFNETLSKKFGGMRIMFGTPVKSKK